jgi:hypothetical protein
MKTGRTSGDKLCGQLRMLAMFCCTGDCKQFGYSWFFQSSEAVN